jgi:hypothetical protein
MSVITSVGTPVNTHATAGSVTGAWGTGQNRAAGNLLVACISAAATTSCTSISLPAGWTNLANNGNAATANARYRICCLVATGGDAAPVSTTTITGTGAMDMTLLELSGTAGAVQDGPAGAEFLSGTSAVTLAAATFIATSAGGPTFSGDEEFSLAWFVQERAAAVLTFTDAGTGWTKIINGNGVSSVLQSALLVKTPAAAGSVQATGAFSTNTTAFGTLRIVTIVSAREPQRLAMRHPAWWTRITSPGGARAVYGR